MPQKTFKQNPALRFITSPQGLEDMRAPDHPMQTLLPSGSPPAQTPPAQPKVERKTKRLNLLLQPSVYEDITKVARMQMTSVNDLVNRVLKDYAIFQAETIKQHDRIFITIPKD